MESVRRAKEQAELVKLRSKEKKSLAFLKYMSVIIVVLTIAIGGLAYQVVALWKSMWGREDMAVQSSYISSVGDALHFVVFFYCQADDGRTEHMS